MKIQRLRSECINCLAKRNMNTYPENTPEELKLEYTKRVLQILLEAKNDEGAPIIVGRITALRAEMFGITDEYAEIKTFYNDLLLKKENELFSSIESAPDPLRLALQYALVGNYIDFGALDSVDDEKLWALIKKAGDLPLSDVEYTHLQKDLSSGNKLVYLTDNCGEIVFDKLLIRLLQSLYPTLEITVIVKSSYVLNDVTMDDAEQVALTELVRVIGNGNNTSGTWLEALSREASQAIEEADLIIAKGQANYETLRYCGKNIYYLFLCKCAMLAKDCNVPLMTGMFINDRRIPSA